MGGRFKNDRFVSTSDHPRSGAVSGVLPMRSYMPARGCFRLTPLADVEADVEMPMPGALSAGVVGVWGIGETAPSGETGWDCTE